MLKETNQRRNRQYWHKEKLLNKTDKKTDRQKHRRMIHPNIDTNKVRQSIKGS